MSTPALNISASGNNDTFRRSSTRSIKRKKFDDELVESSLKSDRSRGKAEPRPSASNCSYSASQTKNVLVSLNFSPKVDNSTLCSGSLQSASSILSPGSDVISTDSPVETDVATNNKSPKFRARKSRRSKSGSSKANLWKAQDDLALITAVQHTCDLNAVHISVKFSRPFSLTEIRERWINLLYNPTISRTALNAMKQLPMEMVESTMRKTPYSMLEEELLKTILQDSRPDFDAFEKLLEENSISFAPARTATCLFHHWSVMKEYDLLPPAASNVEKIPTFPGALDRLNDSDLLENAEDDLEQEMQVIGKREEEEGLEEEVRKWKVVVKNVVGITAVDFDGETYAVLIGRLVQFLMKSREMTIGRNTDDNQVDADLSLEGPAHKISRRHFLISLEKSNKSSGETEALQFFLTNEARRPVFVDGCLVAKSRKVAIKNSSLIEVSCLRFSFYINEDLIKSLSCDSRCAPTDGQQNTASK